MIRYLGPEEKQLCRPLWEEAFPEDTREFLDNYFERKMKENRVLAALDGESEMCIRDRPGPEGDPETGEACGAEGFRRVRPCLLYTSEPAGHGIEVLR